MGDNRSVEKCKEILNLTLSGGTEEQKEAIRVLAKTPEVFKRLFLCDPPNFDE